MGDKSRRCRTCKRNGFEFASGPTDIAAHVAKSLRQHKLTERNEMPGGVPGGPNRRVLRGAVHNRDSAKVKRLINDGLSVNMVIDDVFWDTPLTYAVKCGYLEIVEVLLGSPGCRVDQRDRNKHTALDEAVKMWLVGASVEAEAKQASGRRYRILRRLLSAGANQITTNFLDNLVFSRLNTKSGLVSIGKLVKVFCEKGSHKVKGQLLSVVIPHKNTAPFVCTLLLFGADPQYYLLNSPSQPPVPVDNAVALIRASNQHLLLSRVEGATLSFTETEWLRYRELLRLLTLSGHRLRLTVMNYLYRTHATMYRWVILRSTEPPKLRDLCRVEVRKQLQPNVMVGVRKLRTIPECIQSFILFEDSHSSKVNGSV